MFPRRVALIGAGTIGRQFAGFLTSEGVPITLYDKDLKTSEEAQVYAGKVARWRVKRGLSSPNKAHRGLRNLRLVDSLAEAVQSADLVQEQVYEDVDLKRRVFGEIEGLTSEKTILASSSGGILPSRIQSSLRIPERFLIVHPTSPVHLERFVELVPGPRTSPQTMDATRRFLESHGKSTIRLTKEADGYLLNRLQCLIQREALDIVAKGIATPTEVDRMLCYWGIKYALGYGPLLMMHIHGGTRMEGGIDACLEYYGRIMPNLWKAGAKWTTIPEDVKAKAAEEIKKMKPVREHTVEELFEHRNRRFLKAFRGLPAKDIDSVYL